MLLKISSVLPAVFLFLKFSFFTGEIKASNTLGFLAIAIAVGTVMYLMINGKKGSSRHVVFGIEGKETGPYAGIQVPNKVLLLMLLAVASCLFLCAVLYRYGI